MQLLASKGGSARDSYQETSPAGLAVTRIPFFVETALGRLSVTSLVMLNGCYQPCVACQNNSIQHCFLISNGSVSLDTT